MQGQTYAARDAHVGCWVWEQDVDAMADGVRPFCRGRVFPPVTALRRNISINDYDAWGRRLLGTNARRSCGRGSAWASQAVIGGGVTKCGAEHTSPLLGGWAWEGTRG